jgi:hypothetical protein
VNGLGAVFHPLGPRKFCFQHLTRYAIEYHIQIVSPVRSPAMF